MQRVSTNFTLFLKLFIPIFWIVFFGSVTLALFLTDFEFAGDIPANTLRWGMLIFYVSGLAFLYWSIMRLKRVEMDKDFIFVTNYFKSARYPYHNVERIEYNDFLIIKSVSIVLNEAGIFGKRMTFVPSRRYFQDFLVAHPSVGSLLKTID